MPLIRFLVLTLLKDYIIAKSVLIKRYAKIKGIVNCSNLKITTDSKLNSRGSGSWVS